MIGEPTGANHLPRDPFNSYDYLLTTTLSSYYDLQSLGKKPFFRYPNDEYSDTSANLETGPPANTVQARSEKEGNIHNILSNILRPVK